MSIDQNCDGLLSHLHAPDGILRLTLNDPKQLNALSEAMLMSLGSAIDQAVDNLTTLGLSFWLPSARFCAGHDLREMTAARQEKIGDAHILKKILSKCSSVMKKIVRSPKPVIAEIDGVATAAGCQLVASCDLAIASERAQFCTPGVHIGLFCSTPMVALSRNLSNKRYGNAADWGYGDGWACGGYRTRQQSRFSK